MKWRKESQRTITVESYVTVRSEWPEWLWPSVSLEYNARGHRLVDGKMEWRYFADEIEAKNWADAVHSLTPTNQPA
jgi:hypothetical protein